MDIKQANIKNDNDRGCGEADEDQQRISTSSRLSANSCATMDIPQLAEISPGSIFSVSPTSPPSRRKRKPAITDLTPKRRHSFINLTTATNLASSLVNDNAVAHLDAASDHVLYTKSVDGAEKKNRRRGRKKRRHRGRGTSRSRTRGCSRSMSSSSGCSVKSQPNMLSRWDSSSDLIANSNNNAAPPKAPTRICRWDAPIAGSSSSPPPNCPKRNPPSERNKQDNRSGSEKDSTHLSPTPPVPRETKSPHDDTAPKMRRRSIESEENNLQQQQQQQPRRPTIESLKRFESSNKLCDTAPIVVKTRRSITLEDTYLQRFDSNNNLCDTSPMIVKTRRSITLDDAFQLHDDAEDATATTKDGSVTSWSDDATFEVAMSLRSLVLEKPRPAGQTNITSCGKYF